MSLQAKKWMAGVALTSVVSLSAWGQAAAQAPAGQPPADQAAGATSGPQYADRAEYDLVMAAQKETDAQKRLALLQQWEQKYPNSAFITQRTMFLLTTYQAANDPKGMMDMARKLVAQDPKGIGNYWVTILTPARNDTSEAALAEGEKAANALLANLDSIYDVKNKAATVDAAAWTQERKNGEAAAHQTLGYVASARKDWPKAEQEYVKVLEITPGNGQVSYLAGTAVLQQKNTARIPVAVFHYARAFKYAGPNEVPAAGKPQVQSYLERQYQNYHGSKEGLDQIYALAATTALPPADFKVKSVVDIQKENEATAAAAEAANPDKALFSKIKTALTAEGGQAYFDQGVKGAALPGGANNVQQFKGKVVSAAPAVNPKQIVVAVSDASTPEVTLNFETALRAKVDPGQEIGFSGVVDSFTANPFMLTMSTERKNITGITAAPAAAAPVRRAPVRRKR